MLVVCDMCIKGRSLRSILLNFIICIAFFVLKLMNVIYFYSYYPILNTIRNVKNKKYYIIQLSFLSYVT